MDSTNSAFVTLEVLTCFGTIMDCKANFEAEDCQENKKAAWISGVWRYILWFVGFINMILDIVFIHKLWTTPGIENKYAHLMLGVTIASLLCEYVIFGPLINKLTANIRHWKDRIEMLFFVSFAGLMSFWLEDMTTIYLYFRVDEVYNTEDLADVINLFSSIAAGFISCASLVLTAIITVANFFGAFDTKQSCFDRCSNCFQCIDSCTGMCSGPLGIISVITILFTVQGIYVAVKAIYLKEEVSESTEPPITDIFLVIMLLLSSLFFLSFAALRWKYSRYTNEEFRAKRDEWEAENMGPQQPEEMEPGPQQPEEMEPGPQQMERA